jgi:hypothetical protein
MKLIILAFHILDGSPPTVHYVPSMWQCKAICYRYAYDKRVHCLCTEVKYG